MQKLLIGILLTCCFVSLEAREKQQLYNFSQEKILESFFEELFEKTTLGYVIYGQKPVEITGSAYLDKAIPGTKEHFSTVKMFIGLETLNEIPSYSTKNKYSFIQFTENDFLNVIVINREAFLKIVNQNLTLFKYNFGVNFRAKELLISLENSKNNLFELFNKKIALLGIILGYGVENAITYKNGSSLQNILLSNNPLNLPYQNASFPRNEKELKNQLKNSSSTKKGWAKLKEETKDFSYYRKTSSDDKLKIPFSFHQNSNETNRLFKEYRKSQKKINALMASKPFVKKVLTKLEKRIPASLKDELKSHNLKDFFSENEQNLLPNIIAKSIYNTFSDLDLSILIKGMRSIDKNTQNINSKNYEDISFIEMHRKNALLSTNFRKREKKSQEFFHHIDLKKDSVCLIPQKLYICTIKNGTNEKKINYSQKNINVNYVFKDIKGKVLAGNYQFENSSSNIDISKVVPGFAHGLIGMKEGEIRKIYIHPDFVYGMIREFAHGLPIQVKVELLSFGEISEKNNFPQIKPANLNNDAQNILYCSEFINLQKKYAYFCGLKVWSHYKKAVSLCSFEKVLKSLNELIDGKKITSSNEEKKLLLKLEWLLYQN